MKTTMILTTGLVLTTALAGASLAHGIGNGPLGRMGGHAAMYGMGPGMGPGMGGMHGPGFGMMNGAPGMGRNGAYGGGMGPGMGGPGLMGGAPGMGGMMPMMMQMHGAGGMAGYAISGPMGPMMDGLDADGDGTVTPEEAHDGMQALLAEYDANGDAVLGLDEYAALCAARTRDAMVDGFQALDADGDGQVTADEITAPADRMARMRSLAMPGHGMMDPDDAETMMDGQ